MKIRQIIGWNVRKHRVAVGMSQERLALEAAVDRAYVGRIERGSENVTVAVLEALAVALGVAVSELFVEPTDVESPLPALRPGRKPKAQ